MDKPQVPGSQPTGWRPSHAASGHLATPRASAVLDWPTHEQMETVTGDAGALPRDCSTCPLTPHSTGPLATLFSVPRLYSSLVHGL